MKFFDEHEIGFSDDVAPILKLDQIVADRSVQSLETRVRIRRNQARRDPQAFLLA